MSEISIAGVMITCPGREATLKATLHDLRFSGDHWNRDLRLHIQKDETAFERRQERQEHNALAALIQGLNRFVEAEVLLFFEDDLLFNLHLVWNLQRWSPLRNAEPRPGNERLTPAELDTSHLPSAHLAPPPLAEPRHGINAERASDARRWFFGSLYDPTIRELRVNAADNYFVADPEAVYGSQAFVMSRAMAEYFVAHWWEVEGMQDIKMSRLAARKTDIVYHMPSLVQHVGIKSTWTDDARFHDTRNFDRGWRAM